MLIIVVTHTTLQFIGMVALIGRRYEVFSRDSVIIRRHRRSFVINTGMTMLTGAGSAISTGSAMCAGNADSRSNVSSYWSVAASANVGLVELDRALPRIPSLIK